MIPDREDDSVPKTVIALSVFGFCNHSCLQESVKFFGVGVVDEVVKSWRRKANPKLCSDFAADSPSFEVVYGPLCFRVNAELVLVIVGCPVKGFVQGAYIWTLVLPSFPGNLEMRKSGQLFHGFNEADIVVFHEEADSGSMGSTSKAMIKLFFPADGKRGRLFVMKRTASLKLLARLLECQTAVNQIDNIYTAQ